MELKEYANIERVEKDHWYNAGKREFVRRWIAKVRPPQKDDALLDCGSGTALFAKEMEAYCQVIALDVLEHIEDDVTAVQGFHRVLKPGGVAVITVPASMLLWSEWDVSLHHYRRYNRKDLLALFHKSDWEIVHINYTNSIAFLPALLLRKLRSRKPQAEKEESRAEFRIPPSWLNKLLKWIFVTTSMWHFPMPLGLSLLLVVRKKGWGGAVVA